MIFRICGADEGILYPRDFIRLRCNNWDDFRYKTTLDVTCFDELGREFNLGTVKIGMRGMEPCQIRDCLPKEFTHLPEGFFSLGQSQDYYEAVAHMGDAFRRRYLSELRDIAFDPEILAAEANEPVMQKSLLRDITVSEIRGQFHRMAQGSARLTRYEFTYRAPETPGSDAPPVELTFKVEPQSDPPTNVHALIGRNGCGKTYLIRNMVQCLQNREGPYGRLEYQGQPVEFSNVLCIAFSPFDNFSQLIREDSTLPAAFVGLNKHAEEGGWDLLADIANQFWGHFTNCLIAERKQKLWKEAIEILKSDPTFEEEGIHSFMDDLAGYAGQDVDPAQKARIMDTFSRLSSGHKVVLLIITSCVAEVEERSIVFLDEPENHLHPPLLAALIRALSNLLMDRNGVAIVSTHSPVVLQEVPASCVWKLNRYRRPRRLKQETFGATIGSLTDEVFMLEMTKSGFHKLLSDKVRELGNYDAILQKFDGQLGDEARMLLWTLLSIQEGDGE